MFLLFGLNASKTNNIILEKHIIAILYQKKHSNTDFLLESPTITIYKRITSCITAERYSNYDPYCCLSGDIPLIRSFNSFLKLLIGFPVLTPVPTLLSLSAKLASVLTYTVCI